MDEEQIVREINSILRQLVDKYKPLKVILFGSAARGDYHEVNDLDFLIIKEDVPSRGLDRMRALDDLVDRNMAADMLVYRPEEFESRLEMGDPFLKSIVEEGRVLYG
jgi:predicted nucleotidyltransferase